MLARRWLVVALWLGACGTDTVGSRTSHDDGSASVDDGGNGSSDGPTSSGDGHALPSCLASASDQAGCACDTPGATRACYPSSADPRTRNQGECRDGTQTCMNGGEFSSWDACVGAALPHTEICTDKKDNDCNGLIDCADPGCAINTNCNNGCTSGQTRGCYDGPSGTNGVGTCKSGTQTCANGKWSGTCVGEVTPTVENCADNKDHNCNRLPGCLDLFACATDKACMPMCKPDPGCVCPQGGGEFATCPDGYHGLTSGGGFGGGNVQCCKCTASDCGDPGCCAESVCAGSSRCAGYTCKPLDPMCKGQVGFDCDDFPEDCDVTCCKCTMCP